MQKFRARKEKREKTKLIFSFCNFLIFLALNFLNLNLGFLALLTTTFLLFGQAFDQIFGQKPTLKI